MTAQNSRPDAKTRPHTRPVVEAMEERRMLAVTLGFSVDFGTPAAAAQADKVVTDAGGNVYVAGVFRGVQMDVDPSATHAVNLASAGGDERDDIFVAKYASTGKLLWARRFGGSNAETLQALAIGGDGSLYIGGQFDATTDFSVGSRRIRITGHGGVDGYIARLDPATGRPIWAGSIGGERQDAVTAISVGPNGELYMAGTVRLGGDIDPSARSINVGWRGVDDTFIERLDPRNGRVQWYKIYGENNTRETVDRMVADPSGGVIAAGIFNETVQFDRSSNKFTREAGGNNDIYLARIDAAGRFHYVKSIGGEEAMTLSDMTLAPNGNLYMLGQFSKSANFNPNHTPAVTIEAVNDPAVFVMQTTRSGTLVWAKQFSGDAQIIPGGIAVDASGYVYTTGSFDDVVNFDTGSGQHLFGVDKNTDLLLPGQENPADLYILRLDPLGRYSGLRQLGGTDGTMLGSAIAVDANGGAYLAGQLAGKVDVDPTRGTSFLRSSDKNDDHDGFLVKLNVGTPPPLSRAVLKKAWSRMMARAKYLQKRG